jgi:hypothetical protein
LARRSGRSPRKATMARQAPVAVLVMVKVRASPPRSMRRTSWRTAFWDRAISPTPWTERAGRLRFPPLALEVPMPFSDQLTGSS